MIDMLGFQGAEEAFSDRVIPAIAFAAHAQLHTSLAEQVHDLIARVLDALVGMK
jgi:hypothetical protein